MLLAVTQSSSFTRDMICGPCSSRVASSRMRDWLIACSRLRMYWIQTGPKALNSWATRSASAGAELVVVIHDHRFHYPHIHCITWPHWVPTPR